MTDPLTEAIADGRVYVRPHRRYANTEFLTIDLEAIHTTLTATLRTSFQARTLILNRYHGTQAEAVASLNADCSAYADIILGQLYNKLRTTLERTVPRERVARMNTRCPLSPTIEFPRWISSTYSSIGRMRIIDGPVDKQICYVPPANTQNNYGRTNMPELDLLAHNRLNEVLTAANIDLAPFDFQNEQAAFFPTVEMTADNNLISFHGCCHPSHYENEDIVRAFFLSDINFASPFKSIAFRIGYVDDETTLNALANLAAPAGVPEGTTADSPALPVGAHFHVNPCGIQLAVAQAAGVAAKARGCYIVGRGANRYYACTLAREMAPEEMNRMVDLRITRTRGAQANA
ncbi:ORF1 [Rhodiola cryptic virus 2]|nr:ORF1 [Rhodiola cryptic virus 2]